MRLVAYAAVIVFGTAFFNILTSVIDCTLQKYDDKFQNTFTEQMSRRIMELDFQLTEDKKALEQIEKAREGMSWYSGGVHGIAMQFFGIVTSALVIAGVVLLIALNAPLLFKAFDENGIEPSGGEQQKIAIARALCKNSPVVILDEPTAALDPVAEYDIYRNFNRLVGGKTAIYISHRLSSCKFCDNISVFSEGSIKEYGTHDELAGIAGGIYAEMFAAQAQYYN